MVFAALPWQHLAHHAKEISADNHSDILILEAALLQHSDKCFPMFVHALALDLAWRAPRCGRARHVAIVRMPLVVPEPADADMLDPDSLGQMLTLVDEHRVRRLSFDVADTNDSTRPRDSLHFFGS